MGMILIPEGHEEMKDSFTAKLSVLAGEYKKHFDALKAGETDMDHAQEVAKIRQQAVGLSAQFASDTDEGHLLPICKYVEMHFLFMPKGALNEYGMKRFMADVQKILDAKNHGEIQQLPPSEAAEKIENILKPKKEE